VPYLSIDPHDIGQRNYRAIIRIKQEVQGRRRLLMEQEFG